MKWVLIDLSFLAHRARHAVGNLDHEDIPTGVMYGFFEQLYSICTSPVISSNKIAIFADSRKSYRTREYSEYKKKRREQRTPEEQKQLQIMYDQINKLKNKILPRIGIPVYKQVGLESDDLIAMAAKKLTKEEKEGIVITSDGDLYQCITPYVKWYDPQRQLLMTEKSFEEKYDLLPNEWAIVKSIAGCSSDCVPGLKGIGEKGAIKYITGKMPEHHKQFKIIQSSVSEIAKWSRLVKLPHIKTESFTLKKPKYNSTVFFSFCKHFGIMSYLKDKKKERWIKFFKGDFKGKIKRRTLI